MDPVLIKELHERGELEDYKSSVIQPEIEGHSNIDPVTIVNGKDALFANNEEKAGMKLLFDMEDTVYDTGKADWFAPVMGRGDIEAGSIKIIVEVRKE